VAAAENRDKEAGTALGIYAGGLITEAAHVRDVVRESFALGRATRLEVLDAERQYRDVREAHVGALVEAFEARVLWMLALGGTR
jgi:outer membrane protein TolC